MKLAIFRLLILVASISLAACATKPKEFEDTQQLTEDTRNTLDSLDNPIPPTLLLKQKGPSSVEKRKDLPQSTARRLWNRDRANLRVCVRTHDELVGRVTAPVVKLPDN